MSFLPSLEANASLRSVFKSFPTTSSPLLEYHEVLLRGPSALSVGERELIAAYVSALNSCGYCHGVHAKTATEFGVSAQTLTALMSDFETAPVSDPLRAILRYVAKLTRTPAQMTQGDADAVFSAGWDEQALHDAVSVCALFNFMNRLVEGLGLKEDAGYAQIAARALHDNGYAGLKRALEI
ncbi:MAG: peroxidase-related enzyme [Beijerinckiaceae bacterium]